MAFENGAGGHVIVPGFGWVVKEQEERYRELARQMAEPEPDLSEYEMGSGWYNIGGETLRKNEALAALAELESAPALSMSNTKAELLAAAEGLDVDESNTKAEILEALEA